MGNNNSRISLAPQQDPKIFFQADLPKFVLQSRIGNGKFMKSWLMRVDGVPVTVKVYIRSSNVDDEQSLQVYAKQLSYLWRNLSSAKYPNLLPYQVWLKSTARQKGIGSPVYLIRQHLNANLYDRLSTRPFLHEFEKLWIVYQLLKCLEICHDYKVTHGDIKPENIMCTTWNWVILTDFALFKPTSIPDDDPTDFQYFFDTMSRRRCSVAPERFVRRGVMGKSPSGVIGDEYGFDSSGSKDNDPTRTRGSAPKIMLNHAMDIFSLGCTIAEVFMDGEPLLDLPGMLKYVSASSISSTSGALSSTTPGSTSSTPALERLDQEDSPAKAAIQRISNKLIRQVVVDMTQRDPERRLTAKQYRTILEAGFNSSNEKINSNATSIHNMPEEKRKPHASAFPPYFESLLNPLFLRLHYKGYTPDDRIAIICDSYATIIQTITGDQDELGNRFFSTALSSICAIDNDPIPTATSSTSSNNTSSEKNSPVGTSDDSGREESKEIRQKSMTMARKRQSLIGADDMRQLLSTKLTPTSTTSSSPAATPASPPLSPPPVAAEKSSSSSIEELIKKCRIYMAEVESKYNQPIRQEPSTSASVSNVNIIIDELLESALQSSYDDMNDSSMPFLNNWGKSSSTSSTSSSRDICNGLILIIQIIVSQFRSLKYPQSRVISLMMLARLGFRCSDDVIIQRIIPIFIYTLDDANAYIRSSAIRCVRALLNQIQSISSYESNIFTNYIFPSFSKLSKDPEVIVRVAFAEAIGVLAETSKRFLDRAHLMVQNKAIHEVHLKDTSSASSSGDNNNNMVFVDFSYDSKLKVLHEQISRWIRDLVLEGNSLDYRRGSGLSSHESIIKRAILVDMMRLCVFFGQESTMDLLLTQLLTFLNDQDWELRYAFCAKISSVCSYLGRTVTSECVLPCIENALVDVEEKVVARAVQCLDTLIQQQLLTQSVVLELIDNVMPLLIHPSTTIRQTAIHLVATIAQSLGSIYATVFLLPKLYPNFIRHELIGVQLTSDILTLALITPLSRRSYRRSLLQRQQQLAPGYLPANAPPSSSQDLSMSYSVISPNLMARPSSGNNLPASNERESEVGFGMRPSAYQPADFFVADNPMIDNNNTASSVSQIEYHDEDRMKVMMISTYLDRVAQEMMTKTKQWRNGVNAGTAMGGIGVTLGRQLTSQGTNPSTYQLDSMLEVSASYLPDHSIQSILVPHQKYGVGYFPMSMNEEMRVDLVQNLDQAKSANKIRSLYGLITKPADAARTLQVVAAVTGGFLGINTELSAPTAADMMIPGFEDIRPFLTSTAPTSTANNNKASAKILNSHPIEVTSLIKRIRALNIPPLPPDTGTLLQPDERPYNSYNEPLNLSIATDAQSRSTWRPKENALASTLIEHTAAVNRIAVAPDQTFFVTASSDKTAKVWQIRGIDRVAFPRSVLTYPRHTAAVTDAVSIENSHTVATCSDDGSVHIWRVDVASSQPSSDFISSSSAISSLNATSTSIAATGDDYTSMSSSSSMRNPSMSISGYAMIKTIDRDEGSIVNLQHFNNDMASVLVYASQRGIIHGWDMRSTRDSFNYTLRPELGYPTSSAISPDRHWITIGTNKGYIALWDIRFNVMCKLWQHSSSMPIHRLACSKFMPTSKSSESNAYLIVAAGINETAVWSLPDGGDCLKCFRAVPKKYISSQEDNIAPLPTLRSVPFSSHPLAPITTSIYEGTSTSTPSYSRDSIVGPMNLLQPSVRSILGRISQSSESFLMTGGSDRQIRFWDFLSPTKCYTVSGIEATQQKPVVEAPEVYGGRLFMSYDTDVPSSDAVLQSQLPVREGRGPLPPSNNFRDAILDMKNIDIPIRLMLSASRDGTVKLWR